MMTWTIMVALLIIPVISALPSFQDEKNFFHYPTPTIDPHVGVLSPPIPAGSIPSPSHDHQSSGSNHHEGGGKSPSPPVNCVNPPSNSGGEHKHHNPTPPTKPNKPTIPIISPPSKTPSISTPPNDPHSPPFTGTCDFWKSHPTYIWGLFGWVSTIGNTFGVHQGSNMNLIDALSNTRQDGIGSLYREGTASLLNSMVNHKFPYTTKQVRDSFVAALSSSNKAAVTAQSQLFKIANEATLNPGN